MSHWNGKKLVTRILCLIQVSDNTILVKKWFEVKENYIISLYTVLATPDQLMCPLQLIGQPVCKQHTRARSNEDVFKFNFLMTSQES